MKHFWWSSTAYHLWRAYFAMTSAGTQFDSPSNRKKFELCHPVFTALPHHDQSVLRAFFTAKWGNPSANIEDVSLRYNIPSQIISDIIDSASRAVIENDTLIDKK